MLRTLWDRLLRREQHAREPGVSAEERTFADDGIVEKKDDRYAAEHMGAGDLSNLLDDGKPKRLY
jgi:hypothetical protein